RTAGAAGPLRKKLHHWYDLSGTEFVQELTRQGLNLSVRDKAEWGEIREENKAKITEHLRDAAAAEEAIDRLLLDAYGLDRSDREEIYALS
ncbi:MAG TPA: hypothetical protein VFD26_11325, partial [Methyloceanibacter sp.]|nr:hypothetical protein [Methyloceanibacter sp.]